MAAPSVYAGKFGAKSKRSRKWHFFVAPFKRENECLPFYCLRLSDDPCEVKSSTQKYAVWKNKGKKKEGAVKFSYCDAEELSFGDVSPSKASLFLSPNETQRQGGKTKKKSHSAWLHGHSLISTGLVWHHGNHLRQRRGVNLRWWQITFPFLIFEIRNRLINFKINICGKCSFTDWTRCSCGGCWCLAKSAVGEHHHSHPMCRSDCFLYLSDMFPMSTWEGQPFWKGRKGAL